MNLNKSVQNHTHYKDTIDRVIQKKVFIGKEMCSPYHSLLLKVKKIEVTNNALIIFNWTIAISVLNLNIFIIYIWFFGTRYDNLRWLDCWGHKKGFFGRLDIFGPVYYSFSAHFMRYILDIGFHSLLIKLCSCCTYFLYEYWNILCSFVDTDIISWTMKISCMAISFSCCSFLFSIVFRSCQVSLVSLDRRRHGLIDFVILSWSKSAISRSNTFKFKKCWKI